MRPSRTQGTTIGMAVAGLASAAMLALTACTPPASAGGSPGTGAASGGGTSPQAGTSLPSAGPGWTLDEYSASTVGPDQGGPKPQRLGPTTLYLVSPAGRRYAIRSWHGVAPYLADWSGDGTRALLSNSAGNSQYQQIVLATGAVSGFTLPSDVTSVSYTRPDGLALLAIENPGNSTADRLVRYDLTGHQQQMLWTGQNLGSVIESPDGTAVITGDNRGLAELSNSGTLVRRLLVPGQDADHGCQPVRWWAAGVVLASCATSRAPLGGLFLVPAGGGKVTQLTQPRPGSGPDMGDTNAYQLPSGLFLQALGPCGVTFIAKAQPDGSAKTVGVPGTSGTSNLMLAADSGRLLVKAWTDCGGGMALLWFNPASHSVQWVIRPPAKIEGVLDAVPFGRIGS